MNGLINKLNEYGVLVENESMIFHTSIRIGGSVNLYITPSSVESLINIIDILNENNKKFMIIGRGSNISRL